MAVARLSLWGFAVFVALLPIALIALVPQIDFSKLLQASTYEPLERDLSLSAIAVLAVGLNDIGEAILACNKHAMVKVVYGLYPFLFVMIAYMLVFAVLSGVTGNAAKANAQFLYMFAGAIFYSFIGRIILVAAP